MKSNGEQCIFLTKDEKCSVYDVRPTQCATYPFWPQNLFGLAEWKAEASRCEGIIIDSSSINQTPSSDDNVLDGDSVLSSLRTSDEIFRQVIVHQVHARGLGMDLPYHDSINLLSETIEHDPKTVSDFKDDFLKMHFSNIIFEENGVTVVEYGLPASELGDGTLEDSIAGDNVQATFRKLYFNSHPFVIQTLVRLDNDGSVNHSYLYMAIHQFMASISLAVIQSREGDSGETRILLLGAGGCSLPCHILSSSMVKRLASTVSVKIDAIEPNETVLKIADLYFDAAEYSGLLKHQTTGEAFLESSKPGLAKYSLILVDAAEEVNGKMLAPPSNLLKEIPTMLDLLEDAGMLIINIFGEQQNATSVFETVNQTLRESGSSSKFDAPLLLRIGTDGNYALIIRRHQKKNVESLVDFVKRISQVSDYI